MIYPNFIKEKELLGICAPSAGVGYKLESFSEAINYLNRSFKIIETSSVRKNNYVSNTPEKRGVEFNELVKNDKVKSILCASGGDFLYEMLPYIDFKTLTKNPKWVMGYSDPTSILFCLTTKYDIATIYGFNASSFDVYHPCLDDSINILKGNLITQQSYDKIIYDDETTKDIKWVSNKPKINVKGRIIGGCVEVLNDLIGTDYEDVCAFNDKYSDEGIIWYFDIYSMSSATFYLTLLHFKNVKWFKNVKTIMISRINNKEEEYFSYEEAAKKALGDIPIISDACIGHTFPKMTLINGSICHLEYSDGKGKLSFTCK